MRPHAAVNLLLLLHYPVSWQTPLARAGVLPWFSGSEVSILGGVADLSEVDPLLAGLVALFAIALPYAKTCLMAAAHLGRLGPRAVGWVEAVGRFSMADVFLVALSSCWCAASASATSRRPGAVALHRLRAGVAVGRLGDRAGDAGRW